MEAEYRIVAQSHPVESSITLMLNGKFGEQSLADLNNSINAARGAHASVYLDLSEVTLVDRKALQYLTAQAGSGVHLVNCPVHLTRWIGVACDPRE